MKIFVPYFLFGSVYTSNLDTLHDRKDIKQIHRREVGRRTYFVLVYRKSYRHFIGHKISETMSTHKGVTEVY